MCHSNRMQMIEERLSQSQLIETAVIVVARTPLICTMNLTNSKLAQAMIFLITSRYRRHLRIQLDVGACVPIFVRTTREIRGFWFLDSLKVKGKRNDVADNVARTSTVTRDSPRCSAAVAAPRSRVESNRVGSSHGIRVSYPSQPPCVPLV